MFERSAPLSVSGSTLTVGLPEQTLLARARQRGDDVRLREALLAVLRLDLTPELVLDPSAGAPGRGRWRGVDVRPCRHLAGRQLRRPPRRPPAQRARPRRATDPPRRSRVPPGRPRRWPLRASRARRPSGPRRRQP